MIRVVQRSEPTDFQTNVRAPGQAYLLANPTARKKEKWNAAWQACLPDLRARYKNICAYYGTFIAETTGAATVDHYVPKSANRALAYEWSNYRLACSRMNARKHVNQNVIDPFVVVDGWFELDFGAMTVHAAAALSAADRTRILHTRNRLNLNSSECVRERTRLWENYEVAGDSARTLYTHAPFIALEAVRQGKLRTADNHVTAATIRAWLDS